MLKSIRTLIIAAFAVVVCAVALPGAAQAAVVRAAKGQGSDTLHLPISSGAREFILRRSGGNGRLSWQAVAGYRLGENTQDWAHYVLAKVASGSAQVEPAAVAGVDVEEQSSFAAPTAVELVEPGSVSTSNNPFYGAKLEGHAGTAASAPPAGYAQGQVRLGVPLGESSELYLPIELGVGYENVQAGGVPGTLSSLADHGLALTAAMGIASHSRFGVRWGVLVGGSAGGSETKLGTRPAFIKAELRQPLTVLNRTVEWGVEGIAHLSTTGDKPVLGSKAHVDLRLGEVNGAPITFGPWMQTRSEGVNTTTMGGLRLSVNVLTAIGTAQVRLPVGLNNQGKGPGVLLEGSLERD